MGRTKTKIIDDSIPQVEEKKQPKLKPAKKEQDSLVAKLREELGIVQKDSENSDKPESQKISESVDQIEPEISGTSEIPTKSDTPSTSEFSEKTNLKKKIREGVKSKVRSKKYLNATKDLDRSKTYSISEALDILKKMSYAKFNGTLEIHINTLQTGIRGFTSLPYAVGRKLKILVFSKAGEDFSGAISGNDSTISEVEKGKIHFDLIITTPEWMPKLAKVAKVLGPKGLMPNPKNGTITDDPKKAIESFQSGKTEFKTEVKAPVIHMALGKLNQPNEELTANIKTLTTSIGKTKIKKITLSPTMGAGIRLDLASI